MSLYTELLAAGVPLDHHESDLYAKVTHKSISIIASHYGEKFMAVERFIGAMDHQPWFDIPFAYEPFWTAKQKATP